MPPRKKKSAASQQDVTATTVNGSDISDLTNGSRKRRSAATKAAANTEEKDVKPTVNGSDISESTNGSRKRRSAATKAAAKSEEKDVKPIVNGSNGVAADDGKKMVPLPLNVSVIWQLKEKTGWLRYSPEACDIFTEAAQKGISKIHAESGKDKIEIDMSTMKQCSKDKYKDIRCLFETDEKDFVCLSLESGSCLEPGVAAKLVKMMDISSHVTIEGWKYDLDTMTRTKDKLSEKINKETAVPDKFKKTGVTGKIKVSALPNDTVDIKDEIKDEEDVPPPNKKSKKSTKATGKSTKSKSSNGDATDAEEKPRMKSVIKKGLAPVDDNCPHKDSYHVYVEGSDIWDVMLNQTNIQNNNNKYYLIQLLEADSGSKFAIWMRWGRIGYSGQTSWTIQHSLDAAKNVFTKKFTDKTKNDWEDRAEFEKYNGKYDLVKMDYSAGETKEDEVDSKPSIKSEPDVKKELPVSTLESQVQDLIKLICDISTMEQSVVEMEYDTKKAPLGKITTEQIKAGYEALKRISDCIDKGKKSGGEITQACNDFYTRIPHEFGFRVPPMINTQAMVKQKIGLLEALSDIQVALKMLSTLTDDNVNPVDAKYNQLKVDIKHLEKDNAERKIIEESIITTQGPTHSNYSMEIMDVFKLHKQHEHDEFMDVGNKKLLFHGSRLSNWAGILGQGLRIAPPEAPVTGYMFGKGVYFADCSSKSANYCFTNRSNKIGLMLICEVSLGNQNKLLNSDYNADKLPAGCHSVLGAGKLEPSGATQLGDSVMPTGKTKKTGVNGSGFVLQYNEFIVYKTKQIKMKYLAKIQFNHKY